MVHTQRGLFCQPFRHAGSIQRRFRVGSEFGFGQQMAVDVALPAGDQPPEFRHRRRDNRQRAIQCDQRRFCFSADVAAQRGIDFLKHLILTGESGGPGPEGTCDFACRFCRAQRTAVGAVNHRMPFAAALHAAVFVKLHAGRQPLTDQRHAGVIRAGKVIGDHQKLWRRRPVCGCCCFSHRGSVKKRVGLILLVMIIFNHD